MEESELEKFLDRLLVKIFYLLLVFAGMANASGICFFIFEKYFLKK